MAREELEDMAVSDEARLARIKAEVRGSSLYNEDLAPTEPGERTWTTYNIAALWIGMAIVTTTYTLAAGLMGAGMNWWQALLTISLGNIIVLKTGGIITAILGIVSFPWVLLESVGAYVFTWLVGYGSLLGAIGAVMIADYWILRRRRLNLADLYKMDGRYAYSGGWNWRAIVAVLIGVGPVIPGFLLAASTPNFSGVFENPTPIESLYHYGLFFTFFVTGLAYLALSMLRGREAEEPDAKGAAGA